MPTTNPGGGPEEVLMPPFGGPETSRERTTLTSLLKRVKNIFLSGALAQPEKVRDFVETELSRLQFNPIGRALIAQFLAITDAIASASYGNFDTELAAREFMQAEMLFYAGKFSPQQMRVELAATNLFTAKRIALYVMLLFVSSMIVACSPSEAVATNPDISSQETDSTPFYVITELPTEDPNATPTPEPVIITEGRDEIISTTSYDMVLTYNEVNEIFKVVIHKKSSGWNIIIHLDEETGIYSTSQQTESGGYGTAQSLNVKLLENYFVVTLDGKLLLQLGNGNSAYPDGISDGTQLQPVILDEATREALKRFFDGGLLTVTDDNPIVKTATPEPVFGSTATAQPTQKPENFPVTPDPEVLTVADYFGYGEATITTVNSQELESSILESQVAELEEVSFGSEPFEFKAGKVTGVRVELNNVILQKFEVSKIEFKTAPQVGEIALSNTLTRVVFTFVYKYLGEMHTIVIEMVGGAPNLYPLTDRVVPMDQFPNIPTSDGLIENAFSPGDKVDLTLNFYDNDPATSESVGYRYVVAHQKRFDSGESSYTDVEELGRVMQRLFLLQGSTALEQEELQEELLTFSPQEVTISALQRTGGIGLGN